jgi:hypothetical protein
MKDWRSQAYAKRGLGVPCSDLSKVSKRELFGELRARVGKTLRKLCRQKDVERG